VQWVSENREWSLESVQEVSVMFDLTPLEEQFLIDQFVRNKGIADNSNE
jgi:hypothetical protein